MKKVCIVGFGAIGPIHAEAVENSKNACLYAVCDTNPEKLNQCRTKYPNIKTYLNFDDMLLDPSIDAVHICTPHYLHYEMIKKSLIAKKEIIAEKPAVMTKEELKNLHQLEHSENICFVIQNRLNPCVEYLKSLIHNKKNGTIKAIKGVLLWNRTREYYQSDAWRGKWATEGGGLLINQAIHTLDLMQYLVGNIKSLRANMFNYSLQNTIEVEDTFSAYLTFSNNVKGIFFATNAYQVNDNPEIEIIFENCVATYIHGKLFIDDKLVCSDLKPSSGKDYWGSGHEKLIKMFYDHNSYFNIHEIDNTMQAVFAMYESAKNSGKEILI